MPLFVFRVDSSENIGTGHAMRCLTLASELQAGGAEVLFLCRDFPGNVAFLAEQQGYQVRLLPPPVASPAGILQAPGYARWLGVAIETDARECTAILTAGRRADWIVVDHYGLDRRWESCLRAVAERILAIDDLADREHDCDLLLDQNLHRDMKSRYDNLVPPGCRRLLGPRHALLRREFLEAGRTPRQRDGTVRRILVFFGGCDPGNETKKALEAIRSLRLTGTAVDVVVGATNPHRREIEEQCDGMPGTSFHCQVSRI